jgi:hypothetical protein
MSPGTHADFETRLSGGSCWRVPVRHTTAHCDYLHEPACAPTIQNQGTGGDGRSRRVHYAGRTGQDLGAPPKHCLDYTTGSPQSYRPFRVNYQSHASCADASTARSGQESSSTSRRKRRACMAGVEVNAVGLPPAFPSMCLEVNGMLPTKRGHTPTLKGRR